MKKLISILKLNKKNKKGVIASNENIYGIQTLTDVELSSINGGVSTKIELLPINGDAKLRYQDPMDPMDSATFTQMIGARSLFVGVTGMLKQMTNNLK